MVPASVAFDLSHMTTEVECSGEKGFGCRSLIYGVSSSFDAKVILRVSFVENQKVLTEQEYLAALHELSTLPTFPKQSDKLLEPVASQRSDAEFQLMIDYKLGRDFPRGKRETMLRAHRAMCSQRDCLAIQFLSGSLSQEAYFNELRTIVRAATEQFAAILSPDEFEAFIAVKPGEPVELPF